MKNLSAWISKNKALTLFGLGCNWQFVAWAKHLDGTAVPVFLTLFVLGSVIFLVKMGSELRGSL